MEGFTLSQVCIFSAGTQQGNMLGRNLPTGLCEQKHCSPSLKVRMFHSQIHQENILGADSIFTTVNFCHQQVAFLKNHCAWISFLRAPLLEHWVSWCLVWLCSSTDNKQFTTLAVSKGYWLKCVISVLRHCKETCCVWTWDLGSASKPCSHPMKARMCLSQTYLGKHFGCLENILGADSLFTAINFGSSSWLSEETLCLDLLTVISWPRETKVQNALYGYGRTTQRTTSLHHFLHGKLLF